MHKTIAVLAFCAAAARADVAMFWSGAAKTIVVAHDGRIDGFDRSGAKRLWSADGVESPSSIVASRDGKSIAILDSFGDRVAVVSVADGNVIVHETPSTPLAAAFFGSDVWVVLREPSHVLRISPDGTKTEVEVALDPALIAAGDDFVYVYSRTQGLLQEIDTKAARITRTAAVGTAGSDLEILPPKPDGPPGAFAYLCRPANGRVVAIDLTKMESRDIVTGGAPVDLAFVPPGAELAVDPRTALTADPGQSAIFESKRPGAGGTKISHPTAVDRIAITAAGVFTFDSNGGIVYRIDGRTPKKIATQMTATSFVATDEAIFTWDAQSGKLRREVASVQER